MNVAEYRALSTKISLIIMFLAFTTLIICNTFLNLDFAALGVFGLIGSTMFLFDNLTFRKYKDILVIKNNSEQLWFDIRSGIIYIGFYFIYIVTTIFFLVMTIVAIFDEELLSMCLNYIFGKSMPQ